MDGCYKAARDIPEQQDQQTCSGASGYPVVDIFLHGQESRG